MYLKEIVSIIILFLGIIIAYRKSKQENSFMIIILITLSLSIGIFIYPVFNNGENIIVNIVNTIFYVVQSWILNEDISLVQDLRIGNETIQMLVSIILLCLPILTAGTIIETLQKYFGKFKLITIRNKNIHIFSNINDKSIKISELIKKDYPNDKIVFCQSKENNPLLPKKYKPILIKEDITSFNINNKGTTKFYVLTEDEEECLTKTIELIEKYKEYNKCEILCFTTNEENKIILDELEKGQVIVNIVDEIQNSIYHLLIDTPLYKNAINNKIKVLLVGLGNVGKEIFKTIIWCSQMPRYELEMNIVEKRKEKIDRIKFECPEIIKYAQEYNLNFYQNDIIELQDDASFKEKIKGTNYVIIETGNEENNIKIAKNLRRQFVKEGDNDPEIFIWMKESIKKEKIRESKNPYKFKTFGDYKETYNSIQGNSKLEKQAIKLHLSYNKKDTNLIEYNKNEYNKKSSRATALHLMYKLHPFIMNSENNKYEASQISAILENNNILLELAESEHRRWVAYLRTEGYELADKKVAQRYFNKTGKIREHFIKMHPALVDWNSLEETQKVISEISNSDERDMKQDTLNSIINMLQNIKY